MVINHIKKVKGLYEICFDKETIKYHEEVIIKYNLLKENIEISDDVYKKTLLDNRYFFTRDRAIKYITSFKFISQVRDYLLKNEENIIVDMVIEDLVKYRFIDDYYTATIYTASRYKKGYGNKEIKRKLIDLKVEKEIINLVIEENRELEIDSLDLYTRKLFNTLKSLNKKDLKKKIENRLVSHGFDYTDINEIIMRYDNEINEFVFNEEIFNKQFEKAIKKYLDENNAFIQEKKIINFLMYKGFEYHLIKEKVDMWKKGE
ncbi:MAG: RecX family transcriptional regulator [bacterium]